VISPLPGGIDDTAPQSIDPMRGMKEEELNALEQRIAKERALRLEESKISFPFEWDKFRIGVSKEDNDHEAEALGLPEACANYFRYAGLEVYFKVCIHEDGTVMASHIRESATKEWIALERPVKMNCA
jgi:hypothetical protein